MNLFKVYILSLLIISLKFSMELKAQEFYGGIRGGLLMSQVDGDNFGGFKKLAPSGGVYVRNTFGERWGGMIGVNYKHKGAKEVRRREGIVYFKHEINLDYIQIPVMATYKLSRFEIPSVFEIEFDNDFFIEFGFSYSYLLNQEEIEGDGSVPPPENNPYNNYDLLTHQGIIYRLSEHFLVNFRYSWTFIFFMFPIREHPGGQAFLVNRGEYNRNVSLSLMFEF